jgi:3-oxoacyl-[acyl-carrier protein] reductase
VTARNFAVVTGGSTGIGAEICRQMLETGYEVISHARRKPEQSHARLHAVEVDLVDRSATERAAADIAARYPISHIVHNAGVIRPALLPDVVQMICRRLCNCISAPRSPSCRRPCRR